MAYSASPYWTARFDTAFSGCKAFAPATMIPNPHCSFTGWAYNDSGTMKPGFRDDMTESDFRGHSLDAPARIMSGGSSSAYGGMPCYTLRGAE